MVMVAGYGSGIVEALGLEDRKVKRVVIEWDVDSLVTAKITELVESDQHDRVLEVVRKLELREPE